MMMIEYPHYGDIFDVNLEPVTGSEIGKIRPALIVSNDTNNEFSSTVTVVPISSSLSNKVYPFEVQVAANIAGLNRNSRIKADQVRTISKHRLQHFRGKLPPAFFTEVDKAIKIHLNMK